LTYTIKCAIINLEPNYNTKMKLKSLAISLVLVSNFFITGCTSTKQTETAPVGTTNNNNLVGSLEKKIQSNYGLKVKATLKNSYVTDITQIQRVNSADKEYFVTYNEKGDPIIYEIGDVYRKPPMVYGDRFSGVALFPETSVIVFTQDTMKFQSAFTLVKYKDDIEEQRLQTYSYARVAIKVKTSK
jgi:hypothetical protein